MKIQISLANNNKIWKPKISIENKHHRANFSLSEKVIRQNLFGQRFQKKSLSSRKVKNIYLNSSAANND